MKEKNKGDPMLVVDLEYRLKDPMGVSQGKGRCEIFQEYVQITPEFYQPILFSYRNILKVDHGDYRIRLKLGPEQEILLTKLGYQYDPCIKSILENRNEMMIKDMLAHERLHRKGVRAEYKMSIGEGMEEQGTCELRFYETALILITHSGRMYRISYCFIDGVRGVDYSLNITTKFQGEFILSKLGRELDPTKKLLSERINQRSLETQLYLKEKFPNLDSLALRQAADLLKEGLAVNINDLAEISPLLQEGLEDLLVPANIKEEYDFLSGLAQRSKVCIGLKRSLLGDITGDYIWFIAPIYHLDPNQPGNVLVMEAANIGETEGRATYLFRMLDWEEYRSYRDIRELHQAVDEFIERFNRCMIAINFRREPIYLSQETIDQPKYNHYRVAVGAMRELQFLREHFIGRVYHRSLEQWKEDLIKMIPQEV